jgi:hypothetical protein
VVAAPAAADWTVGEWTPATAWRNAGRVTPRATASTLLWAAANGDMAALRQIFQFDEAAVAKARAWFEALPPDVRALHATPEDLVTGVTLANITPNRAQLSWLHQEGEDRAIVGLLLPGRAASAPPLRNVRAAGIEAPPMLDDPARYKVVVLNLRREADGWRVQVPATAIDNLARNMRAAQQ